MALHMICVYSIQFPVVVLIRDDVGEGTSNTTRVVNWEIVIDKRTVNINTNIYISLYMQNHCTVSVLSP